MIPAGKVATYGQIAAMVRSGLPARVVGYALHGLPENSGVPWHRVINRQGKISYAPTRNQHDTLQKYLLERENITFNNDGKINMDKYWLQPDFMNKS